MDQATGQAVAVKLLDGQRVRAEKLPPALASAMAVEHPALASPAAHGRTEQGWYFVHPWIEGEPLEYRMHRGATPADEAVGLVRKVAEALGALHKRGLAHLGLSPTNVFVTSDGQVRVTDAAVALLEGPGPRLRSRPSQDLQGHLAPEQVLGARDLDARADVFALGVLLFELLAGRPAFSGAYPLAALTRILFEELRLPSPDDRDVALGQLLGTLLSKDRRQRSEDAAAALRALDAWEQRVPASALPPSPFGAREQRLVAVLLVGGKWLADRSDTGAQAELGARLLGESGFEPARLPDSSLITLSEPRARVPEQLRELARIGIELRRKQPRTPVVLATGRGELRGRLPWGDLLDRATALLQTDLRRGTTAPNALRVDALTAALLGPHFPVGADELGTLLGEGAPPAPPPMEQAPGGDDDAEAVDEGASHARELALATGQGQLDALEPTLRSVLRAASIFGEFCWRSGVEAVLGGPVDWRPLLDRGLLQPRLPSRYAGEVEFEFVDEALRAAVYASTLEDDRRQGHSRAAAWLERIRAPGEQVAQQLEQGFDAEGLAAFACRAASAALRQQDPESALRWLDRGEAAGADGLGPLQLLRARVLRWLGHRTQARRSALRALDGLPRDGTEHLFAVAEMLDAGGIVGDGKRIASAGERLVSLATGPHNALACAAAAAQGTTAALRVGKFDLAERLLQKASELAGPQPPAALRGLLLRARAMRARLAGYPAACLKLQRAAVAAFQVSDASDMACLADADLADALLDAGANEEAESLASQTLSAARQLGLQEVEALCKIVLALALQRRASFEVARATVREAAAFFGGRGSKLLEGMARCALATILLAANDLEGARREVERARTACEAFPVHLLRAHVLQAQALLSQGKASEAIDLCKQALETASPLASLIDAEATLRPVRAQALQFLGERDEARRLLQQAERHLLARADDFDDLRLRDAFLRRIPDHARILQLAGLLSVAPPPPDEVEP